jgi:uncharacterized protein (DUF488 family)
VDSRDAHAAMVARAANKPRLLSFGGRVDTPTKPEADVESLFVEAATRGTCETRRMWTDEAGIIGIGYEGQPIEEFVAGLKAWKVTVLVDVRLNPISRKRGFSKRGLTEALATQGLDYLHRPALGNPKDNRAGYSETGTEGGDEARRNYALVLASEAAKSAVEELVQLASKTHVAVLCYEASELHCHRKQILDEVRKRLDQPVSV